MKIRNIPYGYKYVNGEITADAQTKEIITDICRAYLDGESLLKIAERLNRRGVEYREGVTGWNKARIKRIIEDERYLGNKGFPRIISDATYIAMQQIKAERNTRADMDVSLTLPISVPIRCSVCHGELHRRYDSRLKNKTRWCCKNENCNTLIVKSDDDLRQELTAIMNKLIADPNTVRTDECNERQSDEQSQVLHDDIERLFAEIALDREKLQQKLLELASASYTELSQIHSRTKRLKDIFMQASQSEEFPEELFHRTVDEIVLHKDGSAEVILINKQGVKV